MPKLQVVVAHRPPFVFVTDTKSGTRYFSGLLIDLLNRILITGNVSYQYDIYESPTNAGGTLGANGTWNGVIGELVSGKADVALFPLTRTASRLAAIDCTFSYYDAGLALLVGDGQTGPGPLSVLAPFEMTLWVTLLCTVIGVALLFWALDAYGRWIRNKQFDALRASGALSEKAVARAKREEGNPVLISFMAAAGAPERPGRNSWGVQVLYVVYCFFCLIVLSSYTANLTSYLAVRRAYVGIAGLQDLVRDGSLIGINPSGSTAAYFSTSKDSLATQLQPNVRYCDTPTCVAWVRSGAVRAFVTDQPVLAYQAGLQPCDTAVVGDSFGPGNLVIGLQKNSSLLPLFDAAIQSFSEDGTLTSLRRAWFDGLSQCGDSGSSLENTRLTVSQMLGAFVFLVMGVLVAFTTGTIENLKWCLARAYARSYAEGGSLHNMRSFNTMRGSDRGQLGGRSSVLMHQASRLRAATWHRLSVGLLGLPMPKPPLQADMEARGSGGAMAAAVAAAAAPPAAVQPSSGSSTSLRGGSGGGSAFCRGSDPTAPPLRSRTLISTVSAAALLAAPDRSTSPCFGLGGGGGGCNADASPPRDLVLVLQDCEGAGAVPAAAGGCGKVSTSGVSGGGGDATAGEETGGGSPLQQPLLLPMMPAKSGRLLTDPSVRFLQQETHRALPGQPSLHDNDSTSSNMGSSGNIAAAETAAPPPPPSPRSPPSLPQPPASVAAAALTATPSSRGMSPQIPSCRVAPSREGSCNGVFHEVDGQQQQQQQLSPQQKQLRSQQQLATQPASPAASASTRWPPSSGGGMLPLTLETELTAFSHVSSSSDEDEDDDDDESDDEGRVGCRPSHKSLSRVAATAAPGT